MKDFIDTMLEQALEADPLAREAYDREGRILDLERELVGQLVEKRKALGLTQAQVAKRMGITQPRIAHLETLKGGFNLRTLLEYADILGIKLSIAAPAKAPAARPSR